ncbi:hypothetical protein ANAPC5_01184 [Anaplasma phagocytophilum]|nr:hypothetical protein ANAPC5_01184 [Anaplasma phagocytophilum]
MCGSGRRLWARSVCVQAVPAWSRADYRFGDAVLLRGVEGTSRWYDLCPRHGLKVSLLVVLEHRLNASSSMNLKKRRQRPVMFTSKVGVA